MKLKRTEIWQHNSYMGHARMMQMQALNIMNAKTPTDKSKELAAKIYELADKLGESLKKRVDQ